MGFNSVRALFYVNWSFWFPFVLELLCICREVSSQILADLRLAQAFYGAWIMWIF